MVNVKKFFFLVKINIMVEVKNEFLLSVLERYTDLNPCLKIKKKKKTV